MRKVAALLGTALAVLALAAAPAGAMQPPAEPAQHLFGCVDGEDAAVAGHPGANGLTHATPRVAELTGNGTPTAWNAVARADPIELGGC